MGKTLEFSYQKLIGRIVGAVRRAAEAIPIFRYSHNGCIRITIVPLSQEAEFWLGNDLSDFGLFDAEDLGHEIHDICEREFVYKIDPRGSHTIDYVCEDGHIEPVNCYGYSALKTAFLSWKNRTRSSFAEPYMGYFTEDNGWSMHEGSVCTTITLDGEDFIRLYVCTSGAKSTEDEECSLAGMLEAQRCFGMHRDGVRFNPYINDNCTPLEQKWHED